MFVDAYVRVRFLCAGGLRCVAYLHQPLVIGTSGNVAGEVHVPFDRFFHMTAISLSPLDTAAFPITTSSASSQHP